MKYSHIISYVMHTPWAIELSKLRELLGVLAFRAAGHEFTPAEIQARIGGEQEPATSTKRGAVAVIPIRGVIAHRIGSMDESSGGVSTERIASMIRQVAADDSVGTIVYDFDSPGGTIPGVQELAAEMFALRGIKKQVAIANSLMASAAYWLASQADELVSIPSGTVGSIGVYTAHEDLSEMLKKEGVKITLISAGKYKVEGNPFEPLDDDAKAVITDRVNAVYATFVKDVARGRGVSVSAVRDGYGEGRALSAKDAKAAGLIDRITTMDETIGRLVGRKSSGGLRVTIPTLEGVRATFHAEAETLDETAARMDTPEAGRVEIDDVDVDRARRLGLL